MWFADMKILRFFLIIVVFCSLLGCGCYVSPKTSSSFTLAIWNIGHFSNGAKPYSTIDITKDPDIKDKYRELINETINADVFVVNEYSDELYMDKNGQKVLADSALFSSFKYRYVGPRWWKCNAIFSKYRLENLNQDNDIVRYFTAHKTMTDDIKVSKRNTYFLENVVEVGGRSVKIVTVHVDFSRKTRGIYQKAQIAELIERYKKEPRVIICGDFNVGNYSIFEESGFSVANDGSFKTYPSKGYPLDNIVYKGVTVTDVQMYPTTLSDHNPLSCVVVVK